MRTSPSVSVIILAAGRGLRAGGPQAKQWRDLRGLSVVARSIAAFRSFGGFDRLVLVVPKGELWRQDDFADLTVIEGGETRGASVQAGLEALQAQSTDRVLIHDGARPLVSAQIIADVLTALEDAKGAAPALEVTDALWRGADGLVTGAQDRSGLYRAQTPQGFDFKSIVAAHRAFAGDAADDVEVARAAGLDVALVPGEERNLKITRADDFRRAELFLRTDMDIRTGSGFDVHRFGEGDAVTLCGIRIAHDQGLEGHSDADVAMHALTDAIYGALAEGDIGRHFPPSDPQWKGADSAVFLRHAVQLATQQGYRLSNADVTIICEYPKIGPHAAEMIAKLSELMDIDRDRISVKATTSEKLGFTGRGEGIAAQAVVTLFAS